MFLLQGIFFYHYDNYKNKYANSNLKYELDCNCIAFAFSKYREANINNCANLHLFFKLNKEYHRFFYKNSVNN